MMLELIICCFLVFAVAYWVTLWSAGRREDVLHGDFVEAEPERDAKTASAAAAPAAAPRPVFPKKPAPAVVAAPAPPAPVQAQPAAASEQLQSLLASIKSELKNAAQI
jgi:hypothetical protein